jgi:NADPH-dependent 2,4-dienoyl-CoA reductase/sulfur reductase-like enzyme
MGKSKFIVLGGGMVAGYAAKKLVELGLKPGELSILSADNSIPYERPPLSKGFLAGNDTEASLRINPQDFYSQHGIEVRLGCEISGVDTGRKQLVLKSGGEFGYQKLIVATGGSPRALEIPGAELENLYYLRSLDSSKAMRAAADKAKQVVVIGGGFIAMEVAAVMAGKKLEVTMVLNDDRLGKRLFSPPMSDFFESYYASHGVRLVKAASVTELRGQRSVAAVVVNGGQIPCDLVVAGIGVGLNTGFLAGSGIEVGDGVMVNEYLETSQPHVWAGGDIANYPDLIFARRRRAEHWDNAVTQGEHCARALMGERIPFQHVPYFFSDVFDLSYEYWGDSSAADQIVHRGELSSKSFSVWWLRQEKLVAAFVMSRPDEERDAAPRWIEAGKTVSAAKLGNASSPISSSLK